MIRADKKNTKHSVKYLAMLFPRASPLIPRLKSSYTPPPLKNRDTFVYVYPFFTKWSERETFLALPVTTVATAVKGRPYYIYVNLPIGHDEKKKSTLNRENNVKTYLVRTLSTANLYLEFKRFRNDGHLTRGTHKPSSHKLMKFHI